MPVIVLLRHGVSSANTAGILAGRAPGVSLTEEGAVALEANLGLLPQRRFNRLLHSPLRRCVQTAEIAQRIAEFDTVGVDRDVIELDYGDWTGRALKELADEPLWSTVVERASQARFPGGESIAEAAGRSVARVDALVTQLRVEEQGEKDRRQAEDDRAGAARWAMIVSHGDIIRSIIAEDRKSVVE